MLLDSREEMVKREGEWDMYEMTRFSFSFVSFVLGEVLDFLFTLWRRCHVIRLRGIHMYVKIRGLY